MEQMTHTPKRLRNLLLFGGPIAVLAICFAIYLSGGRFVNTDNAYLKADKVPVSTEVSGKVSEVLIEENQLVQTGQVLFKIDDESFKVALHQSEANLAKVRTDLAGLRASYHEKEAEIKLAKFNLTFAEKEAHRHQELAAQGFVARSKLDDVKHQADIAKQSLATLQQDLLRITASLGGRIDLPVEQHPSFMAAQAMLEKAQLDLTRTVVHASMPGVVSKLPQLGQYLTAGSPALSLVSNGEIWIEANFNETDLTHVHPGQIVKIQVDTYPGKVWQGHVDSISPATGSEFSVLPAQNATGNWVKITQRVPVRIALKPDSVSEGLRVGMSAQVEIDTGRRWRMPQWAHKTT